MKEKYARRAGSCLMPVSGPSTQILKSLEEIPLPQTPRYMDTFNDTSVHWFPLLKLEGLPRDLWASREEPDYQDCEDLEIIRKQTDAAQPV